MELETPLTAPPSEYRAIAKPDWQRFFDAFTKVLEGRETEIELIGLGLGDQIQAECLPLRGLTYDPNDDIFYVYLEDADNSLDHAIAHPREILIRSAGGGIAEIVAMGSDGLQHVIHLRQPISSLEIPAHVS